MRVGAAVCSLLLLGSCTTPSAMMTEAAFSAIDTARVRLEDVSGWRHAREVMADLNGDGRQERVILASDVTVGSNGQVLWEDGHRWGAVVEDAGQRTLLYGAFVPNGHVEMAIVDAQQAGGPGVLIAERTPHQLRTFTVAYDSPGRTRVVSGAIHPIANWLPSLMAPQP